MLQVRFHGRGGQGVVTAAELLSIAAFAEGRSAQAFPTFGSERMGAPVAAFCRIDDGPIRVREPIVEPDVVVVQDPTLLHQLDVFAGLRDDGTVLINTTGVLDLGDVCARVVAVPATELARRHLGRPLPNAALLGAFAAVTGAVGLESVGAAIRSKFHGAVGEGNVAAAEAAYAAVGEAVGA